MQSIKKSHFAGMKGSSALQKHDLRVTAEGATPGLWIVQLVSETDWRPSTPPAAAGQHMLRPSRPRAAAARQVPSQPCQQPSDLPAQPAPVAHEQPVSTLACISQPCQHFLLISLLSPCDCYVATSSPFALRCVDQGSFKQHRSGDAEFSHAILEKQQDHVASPHAS